MELEKLIDQNDQALLGFVRCECPQECDCENPPPDDWDGKNGVFHASTLCPEHNWNPLPEEHCLVHGEPYEPYAGDNPY